MHPNEPSLIGVVMGGDRGGGYGSIFSKREWLIFLAKGLNSFSWIARLAGHMEVPLQKHAILMS